MGELAAHRSLSAARLLGGVAQRATLQLVRELHGTLRGDLRLGNLRLGRGCLLDLLLLSLALLPLPLLLNVLLPRDVIHGIGLGFGLGRRFGCGCGGCGGGRFGLGYARGIRFVRGNLRIRRRREDDTLGGDVKEHPLPHEVPGVVSGLLILGRGQRDLLLPGSDGEMRQVRQIPRQHDASDLFPRSRNLLVAVRAPHQRDDRCDPTLVPVLLHRTGFEAVALLQDANHRSPEHDGVVARGVGPGSRGRRAEHRRDEPGELKRNVRADDGVDERPAHVFLNTKRLAETDGRVAEAVDERLGVSLHESPRALQGRAASQRILLRRDWRSVLHPRLELTRDRVALHRAPHGQSHVPHAAGGGCRGATPHGRVTGVEGIGKVTRLLVPLALDARARGLQSPREDHEGELLDGNLREPPRLALRHRLVGRVVAHAGGQSPGEDAADIDGRPERAKDGLALASGQTVVTRGPVVQGPHGLLELLHLRAGLVLEGVVHGVQSLNRAGAVEEPLELVVEEHELVDKRLGALTRVGVHSDALDERLGGHEVFGTRVPVQLVLDGVLDLFLQVLADVAPVSDVADSRQGLRAGKLRGERGKPRVDLAHHLPLSLTNLRAVLVQLARDGLEAHEDIPRNLSRSVRPVVVTVLGAEQRAGADPTKVDARGAEPGERDPVTLPKDGLDELELL